MKRDRYESFICSEALGEEGFIGGQELSEKLVDKFGITSSNARKIVERAAKNKMIFSSAPYTFGKRQYIYFISNQFSTLSSTLKVSKKYNHPLYRMITALLNNDGVLSVYEAKKITASAYKNKDSKKTSFSKITSFLKAYGLVSVEIFNDVDFVVASGAEENLRAKYDLFVQECCLVLDILRFVLNMYLVDDANVIYRSGSNMGGCIFHDVFVDAFGYSSAGFSNVNNADIKSKTCIVLDVVLTREYLVSDLDGFYERVAIIKHSVKHGVRDVIPIVAYYKAEKTVASRLKGLGFLRLNLSTVFGSKINGIIKGFSELDFGYLNSTNAAEKIKKVLSEIDEAGQKNNLQNIRGRLFEFIIYILLRSIYTDAEIIFSKKIKNIDKSSLPKDHEYDFFIQNSRASEIVLVEVKGYKKNDRIKLGDEKTKNSVKWFFENKLKFARKNYTSFQSDLNFRLCYITTASFESDAVDYLTRMNNGKLKPSSLDVFYDGNKLLELLKSKQKNELSLSVREFYMS